MNISDNSFIEPNFIVSEIARKSGDREFKYESEGHYMSLVQEALQELSFDTLFLEKEKVFDMTDGCLKLKLPSGAFNITNIFGLTGENCDQSGATNIYYKRNFRNGTARDMWNNHQDPFYPNRVNNTPSSNLYFCGIVNGVIHLSPSCQKFSKVVVRFKGVLADIGDKPFVPMFFRQAVVDWGVAEALSIRIAETTDNAMVAKWQAIMNRYDSRRKEKYDGSWDTARYRVKNMDEKTREDYAEYYARMDY